MLHFGKFQIRKCEKHFFIKWKQRVFTLAKIFPFCDVIPASLSLFGFLEAKKYLFFLINSFATNMHFQPDM